MIVVLIKQNFESQGAACVMISIELSNLRPISLHFHNKQGIECNLDEMRYAAHLHKKLLVFQIRIFVAKEHENQMNS